MSTGNSFEDYLKSIQFNTVEWSNWKRSATSKKSFKHFQPSDLTQVYDLVGQLSGEVTVGTLCAVLHISRTAYYRYRRGTTYQLSDSKAENQILVEQIFTLHKRRYGSRCIVLELQHQGYQIGRQQVISLMQSAGLGAIQPKSFVPRTTDSSHGKGYWPNLLLDRPLPMQPNSVWVSDITYLPLVNG